MNQSPSPSSRVCVSWVPPLQFNDCLYVESSYMSLSTPPSWRYSYCVSPLEFMMSESVICRRMAADWRDSGWQEFPVAVPVQWEVEFIQRSWVYDDGTDIEDSRCRPYSLVGFSINLWKCHYLGGTKYRNIYTIILFEFNLILLWTVAPNPNVLHSYKADCLIHYQKTSWW